MDGYIFWTVMLVLGILSFVLIYRIDKRQPPTRSFTQADTLSTFEQVAGRPRYHFTRSENGSLRFEADEWPDVIE